MALVARKMMLKSLITKVMNGLAFLAHAKGATNYCPASDEDDNDDEAATSSSSSWVPEDVREGHFVVIAMEGGEGKRFIVGLDYLKDPEFLRLLEKAREEYGFGQKGVLAVPCTPQQLHNIIHNRASLTHHQ